MLRDVAMRSILVLALAGAGALGFIASASAQALVAVVEDVTGEVVGAEYMDYVALGTTIELGPKGSIVLGYMKSCWRETITGGTVTVGAERSTVDHGKVERTIVDCDASHIQLTDRQAGQSAATVFRHLSSSQRAKQQPQFTIYGCSPVVEAKGPGTLVIERLDQPGERLVVTLVGKSLLRGRFYDLANANDSLTPGATYLASLGELKVVFKVDARAKPGSTPIIGRLLRFAQAR